MSVRACLPAKSGSSRAFIGRSMSEDQNLVPARPIGNIYCGTCSWTDRTLIESGGFYAADIRSPEARLRYYAQVFPIVEVDFDLLRAALRAERAALGGADAARLRLQHQGVWPADAASGRPAPASRRRPRAAAERRAGEGPALSCWRAGRCPRARLDDAHRGAAAARRGRQARLPAVSVSAVVPQEPRQRRLPARASRAAAVAGRRRVPRRRLDGSGAAEPHAEAAGGSRPRLRQRRRAAGLPVIDAAGGRLHLGARRAASARPQRRDLGEAEHHRRRALPLPLLRRRAARLGRAGPGAGRTGRAGARADEQLLPGLRRPQRPPAGGAAGATASGSPRRQRRP